MFAKVNGQLEQSVKRSVSLCILLDLCQLLLFFFSSRRRHTRYWRDWSSDVCSSDLLPSARSLREGVMLLAAAAAVPVALLAPWLVADAGGTIAALRANDGLPGFGGISLLVQPDLSALWLQTKDVALSATSARLFDGPAPIALAAVLAAGALMLRRRTPPLAAAVLLWVTFYALGINFSLQYLVWGIPFFLMARRLRTVAVLQAVLLVPTALLYGVGSRDDQLHLIYTPVLLLVWAGFVVWLVVELRRSVLDRDARRVVDAVQQQRPGVL